MGFRYADAIWMPTLTGQAMERQLNYLPGYLPGYLLVLALAGCGYPGRNLVPTEDLRLLWTASEVLLAFLFLVVLSSKHTGGARGRQLTAKHGKLMPVKKYRELFDGALVFCIMTILVLGMAVVMLSWVPVDNQRKLRSQKKHLETVSQLSYEIQALKSVIEEAPQSM